MTATEKTDIEKKAGQEECKKNLFNIDALKEARKNATERMNSYNEKYFKKFAETGKAFAEDFRKDTNELFDRMVETGKKIAPKLPFADRLEKTISEAVARAATRLNIPRRDDVERLSKAIESLNEKVGGLSAGETKTPKK
jgi:polyhydroxyalkanoate synthesis regulator phasin